MEPSAAILIVVFQANHDILRKQCAGITQAESLLPLPFRGNCLNWVAGHILGIYSQGLELLGLPAAISPAENEIYGYGSEPLTDHRLALPLEDILQRLDSALAALTVGLTGLTADGLQRPVRIWRGQVSLHEGLSFYQWHASFHTGQLELLRQLAGKDDKII